jgi:hypothetical protein
MEIQKKEVISRPGFILHKYKDEEYYRKLMADTRNLGTYDYEMTLKNHYDFQYEGSLYMGSQK